MANERAAMAFTDPPYNVPVAGHVCGLGAVRHREFPMASGEMSADHVEAGWSHRATEKLLRTRAREAKDPMDRVRFEAEAERYAGEAAQAEAGARR